MTSPSQRSRREKLDDILNLLETLPRDVVESLLENWLQLALAEGWLRPSEADPLRPELLSVESHHKDV